MKTRRSIISTLAGSVLVSIGGCGYLGDTLEAEAAPAGVTESAVRASGYRHERTSDFLVEDTIEIRDESREVRLTNWLAVYAKRPADIDVDVDLDLDAAQYSVLTSPTVSVAGRDVNPLDRMDDERLLRELVEQLGFEGIEDVEALDSRPVGVLGESVEITRYEATTTEEAIDVILHLGHLVHDGDFLALLGAHPTQIDETENVNSLAEGTEHPLE